MKGKPVKLPVLKNAKPLDLCHCDTAKEGSDYQELESFIEATNTVRTGSDRHEAHTPEAAQTQHVTLVGANNSQRIEAQPKSSLQIEHDHRIFLIKKKDGQRKNICKDNFKCRCHSKALAPLSMEDLLGTRVGCRVLDYEKEVKVMNKFLLPQMGEILTPAPKTGGINPEKTMIFVETLRRKMAIINKDIPDIIAAREKREEEKKAKSDLERLRNLKAHNVDELSNSPTNGEYTQKLLRRKIRIMKRCRHLWDGRLDEELESPVNFEKVSSDEKTFKEKCKAIETNKKFKRLVANYIRNLSKISSEENLKFFLTHYPKIRTRPERAAQNSVQDKIDSSHDLEKPLRGVCKKKETKKLPTMTIDDVCECSTDLTPDNFCTKGSRGCRLTTKVIKPVPFPLPPLTTYEDLTQKKVNEVKDFVFKVKDRAQSVLLERPKDTQIKLLVDKLRDHDISNSMQSAQKQKKTRPFRVLSNREIMNKIMRRKVLRDRKCGERLGPYHPCDPLAMAQDIFYICKADRFKTCIQKKKQHAEEELTRKKEIVDLATQTEESYVRDMKNQMVTKETLQEEEMNKLREVQRQKEEKKRLRKLKREASVTVLDWNVKPNPCKTLLNAEGECPEKDVNDSDEDSDDQLIECTCGKQFDYCLAMDFLRRKDYKHNWMPTMKCASPINPKNAENHD